MRTNIPFVPSAATVLDDEIAQIVDMGWTSSSIIRFKSG